MQIKPIYIYTGENGTIQTPVKLPMQETKQMRRLIADEGKVLKKGEVESTAIDVDINDIENWVEMDEPEEKQDI